MPAAGITTNEECLAVRPVLSSSFTWVSIRWEIGLIGRSGTFRSAQYGGFAVGSGFSYPSSIVDRVLNYTTRIRGAVARGASGCCGVGVGCCCSGGCLVVNYEMACQHFSDEGVVEPCGRNSGSSDVCYSLTQLCVAPEFSVGQLLE